ncbi:MAG: DUF1501 domain-containing protein [Phycisphaeraceae bacterium]|nr:DUF1501 domain-containing protein [Phycisphaeraceae bacterium]MCW5764238.1 DUF1501 domain-containing protein [Phycisphaeraceae bacterium]
MPVHPLEEHYLDLTRRRFFSLAARGLAAGLGGTALGSMLGAEATKRVINPGDPAISDLFPGIGAHFAPKAKRVIYMHMEGAPSQIDLFDYKPALHERFNEELPDSIRMGQRLTGMTSGQARFPVAPSMFKFDKYRNNDSGLWMSELLPHTASVAHELCVVYSMHTEAINHEPGITFFQTGSQQPGRASFGSWVSYGLGSANANLPTFVVLITQGVGNMQALSARFWGSGFLPSEHQGCKLRAAEDPVLFLKDPHGVSRNDRRRMLDLVGELNALENERTLDPEIRTRIAQYEMAYRMQMSVPDLTDFSNEDAETLALYGPDVSRAGSFAANCLLARRLAERGVRFIQLYMRGWDQHNNLPNELRAQCKAVDQPQAALIKDLRRRGLLDETLILWSGEFGRTVYSQGTLTADNYGRDHHPRCFSLWLAGGGIKPGITYGRTDDYSYNIVENPMEVHDLHATMLHLLGIDHARLKFRSQGRDFRLTDVFGKVNRDIIT